MFMKTNVFQLEILLYIEFMKMAMVEKKKEQKISMSKPLKQNPEKQERGMYQQHPGVVHLHHKKDMRDLQESLNQPIRHPYENE